MRSGLYEFECNITNITWQIFLQSRIIYYAETKTCLPCIYVLKLSHFIGFFKLLVIFNKRLWAESYVSFIGPNIFAVYVLHI